MAMGMTYEEYWQGNPSMAVAFREAYKIRKDEEDAMAWSQGAYFYEAVSTALYNAFLEKGKRTKPYREHPFRWKEPEKSVEQIRDEVVDGLKRFEEAWNARTSKQNKDNS